LEKSDLRKWLNTTFIDTAFSKKQADKYIAEMENITQSNSKYGTSSGKETKDKVFLLSEMEFNMYLDDNLKKAKGSKIVVDNGYTRDGNCFYWLRTAGGTESNAMNISPDGEINHIGYAVNHSMSEKDPDKEGQTIYYGSFGVRPAMWINLK
jgi:hypothetical protein